MNTHTIYRLSVPDRDGRKTYTLPLYAIIALFSAYKRADQRFTWKRRGQVIRVSTEGPQHA